MSLSKLIQAVTAQRALQRINRERLASFIRLEHQARPELGDEPFRVQYSVVTDLVEKDPQLWN